MPCYFHNENVAAWSAYFSWCYSLSILLWNEQLSLSKHFTACVHGYVLDTNTFSATRKLHMCMIFNYTYVCMYVCIYICTCVVYILLHMHIFVFFAINVAFLHSCILYTIAKHTQWQWTINYYASSAPVLVTNEGQHKERFL